MNDHDLLIRMDEKLTELSIQFSNHLKHHWAVTIPLLLVVVGLVITLLIK